MFKRVKQIILKIRVLNIKKSDSNTVFNIILFPRYFLNPVYIWVALSHVIIRE